MTKRTLYQFPISHYCDKARWALDHKGLDYDVVNLMPGEHLRRIKKLTRGAGHTVPLLCDGDETILGSAQILSHLDASYPHTPCLTPTDPTQEAATRQWETLADEIIGPSVRRVLYWELFKDSQLTREVMQEGLDLRRKLLLSMALPVLKRVMRKGMQIDAVHVERSTNALLEAFEKLCDHHTSTGSDYLVGDTFTRADIAVSALLRPMLRGPDGEVPVKLLTEPLSTQLHALRWILDVYEKHRNTPTTVHATT